MIHFRNKKNLHWPVWLKKISETWWLCVFICARVIQVWPIYSKWGWPRSRCQFIDRVLKTCREELLSWGVEWRKREKRRCIYAEFRAMHLLFEVKQQRNLYAIEHSSFWPASDSSSATCASSSTKHTTTCKIVPTKSRWQSKDSRMQITHPFQCNFSPFFKFFSLFSDVSQPRKRCVSTIFQQMFLK